MSQVDLLPIPVSRPAIEVSLHPLDLRARYIELAKVAGDKATADARKDITCKLAASGALQIMKIAFRDVQKVQNQGASEPTSLSLSTRRSVSSSG